MTADTNSALLGFLIMGTGNDNNSWGANANSAVFQVFEDAIAGALTSSVSGGTLDLSGSPPPAAASQTRYAALIFTGTLGSNQIVQVPNLRKFWFVQNATAGAFTLKLQTPTAVVSTAIPQNSGWQVIYCDGANTIWVFPFNTQQIQMPDGTVAAPAYSNVNEPKSGWWRAGTQDWRLSINGTDVLQVTGTGAGTPSIVNVLSPNVLQQNGAQVSVNWVAAGGTADAITATYSPAITTLTDGLLCFVRATAANATTTPTFAPNGLTAHTITKKGGVAVAPNDIPGALAEIILRYNLANARWELLNPTPATYTAGASLALTGFTFSNSAPPPGEFKNLSIKVASNTTVAIAADFVVTTDGTNWQTTPLSATINLATNGAANALDTGTIAAATWYAIWAIAKPDGTTAALASLSATAPTLPSGYTYKRRYGWVRTAPGVAQLIGTWQFGRRAGYVVGLAQCAALPNMANGINGSTYSLSAPTYSAVSVSNFVPSTASAIEVIVGNKYNNLTGSSVVVAPNAGYGGLGSLNAPPFGTDTVVAATIFSCSGSMLLESTNIYYAANTTGGMVSAKGWEDNL